MGGTLLAAAWFALFVVIHWLGAHWLAPARRARLLVVGYGLCCLGLIVTVCVRSGGGPGLLLAGIFAVMTMACLLVLYAPAYYVIANSLSVQSMVVLLEHPQAVSRADLDDRFAGRRLLRGRLVTLVQSGYASPDGGGFRITPRGRRLIGPFLALKSLWRLGPGG